MRVIGLVLVLVATIAFGAVPSGASEFDDGKMIPRGQSAASGTGKGLSFKDMLSRIKTGGAAAPTEVEYTFEWLDAQPPATGDAEFQCLAEALYFEARGETVKGQFAVAEVISNRALSPLFPDTICGVITQGNTRRKYQCQFTYKCDGHKDVIAEKAAYARVAKVARAVLDGYAGNLTEGATYYHTRAVRPAWARRFTRTATIGVHYFYRRGELRASN